MFPGMPDFKSSPEELKTKILAQAQNILMVKFNSEYQKMQLMISTKEISGKDAKWPDAPSTEKIIKEADKLYRYLNKK